MKHVIMIETVTPIGPFQIDDLRNEFIRITDRILGEDNCLQFIANQNSAIRGVYNLFGADTSKSPDEHQSAKQESIVETEFELRGYTVRLKPDNDSEGQDEWEDGTNYFFATTHNRYFEKFGPAGEDADDIGEDIRENIYDWEEEWYVHKLYMYAHSGVALSLSPFSCPWDSGQVGFFLVKKSNDIPAPDDFAKVVIEEWNQYLSGNVWQYSVEDGDGEIIDSWGVYQEVR